MMNKKTRNWLIAGVVVIAIVGIGGYTFMKSYLGNKVAIESVVPAQTAAAESTGAATSAQSATGSELNGNWAINDKSKVYFSVTTSQETVNFVDNKVSGSWNVNVDDPSKMTSEGQIDMSAIDSGTAQRDEHVKSADFFDVAQFPNATFKATSFENVPKEWVSGATNDFKMTGTLTVKGKEKEVTFDMKGVYQDGQVLLSGTTKVTFADFGMKNPHSVVLSTQNDINVQLELVLDKKA
ncbi:YceI family protein [Paenibacillus hunanensis]|uniref:Polyisoprenoid-binding protein YceI n=1 Tax=Paenibacillus hunanensis TaxID=539262 RepID=A0ABU1IUS0_9BACL|nr:YceI family protein [Paenibacillus hunanensis]MDR6243018.1 polyisoprenoid-binding protein YceI [Paenibacillus hunanensis]